MNLLVLTYFPPWLSTKKYVSIWKLLVQWVEGDKPLSHRQWDEKMRENLKGKDARQEGWCDKSLGILQYTCAGVNLPLPLEHFSFSSSQFFFLPYNCGRVGDKFSFSTSWKNEKWKLLVRFQLFPPLRNLKIVFLIPTSHDCFASPFVCLLLQLGFDDFRKPAKL